MQCVQRNLNISLNIGDRRHKEGHGRPCFVLSNCLVLTVTWFSDPGQKYVYLCKMC